MTLREYHPAKRKKVIVITRSSFAKFVSPDPSRYGKTSKTSHPYPIGSMYAIYGNIYHHYTPNVSIYTIHGSYGYEVVPMVPRHGSTEKFEEYTLKFQQ